MVTFFCAAKASGFVNSPDTTTEFKIVKLVIVGLRTMTLINLKIRIYRNQKIAVRIKAASRDREVEISKTTPWDDWRIGT